MTKKQELINTFKDAREFGRKFVGVLIELPNHPGRELIINSEKNFDVKEEYYINNYDDNLHMIRNSEIKIIRCFTFNKMDALSSLDLNYRSEE